MTPLQSRLTLMVDEWLGLGLVVGLWLYAGWPVDVLVGLAIAGLVVFVYAIGYPMHWRLERRHREKRCQCGLPAPCSGGCRG
jgi:membrane-associated phospholipid phosphatase